MSRFKGRPRTPFTAASALGAFIPVSLLGAPSALDDTIVRTGSINEFSIGFTGAAAGAGQAAGVVLPGAIGKGVAAASLGNGALLAVGSTNGRLIPVVPSAAATAMALRYTVGVALEDAVDAAEFKVLINPAQLV